MAKLFSAKGFSRQFGESFLASYELERKLKERQQEIEREYNFKRRQLNLAESFRRDQLNKQQEIVDINKKKFAYDVSKDYVPIGNLETQRTNPRTGNVDFTVGGQISNAPLTTGQTLQDTFGVNIGRGNFIRKDLIPAPQERLLNEEIKNGQLRQYFGTSPEDITKTKVSNLPASILNPKTNPSDLTTPYINTLDSDKAFNEYKKYTGSNLKAREKNKFEILTGNPKGNAVLPRSEIEAIKKQKLKELEAATDNDAKKFNEYYKGFEQTYKKFIKKAGKGEITPKNLEEKVRGSLSAQNAPVDMINAMLNLLKKRIF